MAKDKKRLRKDRAGIGPDPERSRRRLVSLADLSGYSLGDGEPDVRGWDVRTLSGRELGEVEDLLVDPERGEVIMLEVEMRGDGIHAEVPIRSVQLDRDRKVVIVDSADVEAGHDTRARDRMDPVDRDQLRGEYADAQRAVRYGELDDHVGDGDVDEVVVERRPVVEEVVVRRRPADE
ncbi:MAG: PRC-barrel domain-containing protein [Gemmatimonadota bacterium]